MASSSRRLKKELADIQSSDSKTFCNIEFDENNLLHWTGLLVPSAEYGSGAHAKWSTSSAPFVVRNRGAIFPIAATPLKASLWYQLETKGRFITETVDGEQEFQRRSSPADRLAASEKEPYNKGAFKVSIDFPVEYPFKPPKITFLTKIYHPNVDEKGQVCLPIVAPDNWKPATKTEQVMNALLGLIAEPEPDHPLRADLAEEFTRDRKKFNKNAEEYTKKHGFKRPDGY